MEHPILKNQQTRCIMKIQKRSESNVLSKLPFKTVESRGYVNDGTQQLHEITLDSYRNQVTSRGLFLLRAVPADNVLPTRAIIVTPLGVAQFATACIVKSFSRSERGHFLLPATEAYGIVNVSDSKEHHL